MSVKSLVAMIGLSGAALVTGCEAISSDFGDLAEGIFTPTPAQAARMAIDPSDPDQRRKGLTLLAGATFGGAEPYLRLYRDYAENAVDPLVRAAAVRGLARHGTPEDAILIATQLDDPSDQVRWEAAKGLQRLHNPDVVLVALSVLRNPDEDANVREAIAIALGQYPEDRVFQGLVAALDAQELSVNAAAGSSLEILTGASLGLDPRPWLKWYDDTEDPFAGQQEFMFPTYRRDPTFMERLAFWSTPAYEQPAPPAGSVSATARTTYGDGGETE